MFGDNSSFAQADSALKTNISSRIEHPKIGNSMGPAPRTTPRTLRATATDGVGACRLLPLAEEGWGEGCGAGLSGAPGLCLLLFHVLYRIYVVAEVADVAGLMSSKRLSESWATNVLTKTHEVNSQPTTKRIRNLFTAKSFYSQVRGLLRSQDAQTVCGGVRAQRLSLKSLTTRVYAAFCQFEVF